MNNLFSLNINLLFTNNDQSIQVNKDINVSNVFFVNEKILKKILTLEELETDVEVLVSLTEKAKDVFEIKSQVKSLHLNNLMYAINFEFVPKTATKIISFDEIDYNSEIIHESFAFSGFDFGNKKIGILPGLGYKNHFTRVTRHRSKFNKYGFSGFLKQLDQNLIFIDKNKNINLNFGEKRNYKNSEQKLIFSSENFSFENIELELRDGMYKFVFEYNTSERISFQLQDLNSKIIGFDYNYLAVEEKKYSEQCLVSGVTNKKTILKFYKNETTTVKGSLKIYKLETEIEPYHRLEQNIYDEKNIFVFESNTENNLRNNRLEAQVKFAEALGYNGTEIEKILYATAESLVWISDENDFSPHVVPNKNYSPDMYNRDSFWTIIALENKYLNEEIYYKWAKTQDELGCIGTIITPSYGSKEIKGNDATLEFLWWTLLNKQRFNSTIDKKTIDKAVNFVLTLDKNKDGTCHAEYILGQNDVIDFIGNPSSDISVNQGMFAVTLKVIKALGYDISNDYINSAVKKYQDFYDTERKFLLNTRLNKEAYSYGDLLPEFVSLWLFGEKMLTSETVINSLNKYQQIDGIGLFIGHIKNKFFESDNHPFAPNFVYEHGVYYNGGSWMREEICAYQAGKAHGWIEADARIQKRLSQEINYFHDEPFSHEHISLKKGVLQSTFSTHVFAWNVFVNYIKNKKILGGY